MADQQTLPGIKPRREGRKHADRAAKQADYRERNQLKVVAVQMPIELADRLDAYLAAKGRTKEKSDIICRLIESQLLRKR